MRNLKIVGNARGFARPTVLPGLRFRRLLRSSCRHVLHEREFYGPRRSFPRRIPHDPPDLKSFQDYREMLQMPELESFRSPRRSTGTRQCAPSAELCGFIPAMELVIGKSTKKGLVERVKCRKTQN
ncbi:MAG: hypothetical protein J6J31_15440 [Thermoguttaceae bacterium]|nr:hypothetical protein [Thermoguttaceae bacterium]